MQVKENALNQIHCAENRPKCFRFLFVAKDKMMKNPRRKISTLCVQGSKLEPKISSIYRAQIRGRSLKLRRHSNFVWFILARKEEFLDEIENADHPNPIYFISNIYFQSSWFIAWVATPQICRNLKFEETFQASNQQGICDLWLEFCNFSSPNHWHGEFVICYWIFVILKTLPLVFVIGICYLWLSRLHERNL